MATAYSLVLNLGADVGAWRVSYGQGWYLERKPPSPDLPPYSSPTAAAEYCKQAEALVIDSQVL